MHRTKAKFSVVELVVVIGILTLLAALLLPTIIHVKSRGRLTACSGNMRQVGMAIFTYQVDNNKRMPIWLSNLYPKYIDSEGVFHCQEDPTSGRDGSIRGAGHDFHDDIGNNNWFSILGGKDESVQEFDSGIQKLRDHHYSVDDTYRNSKATLRNPNVTGVSYMYEFNDDPNIMCWWYGASTLYSDKDDDVKRPATWYNVKMEQMANGYGREKDYFTGGKSWGQMLFPMIRCFHHVDTVLFAEGLVTNVSYDGSFYKSKQKWEDGHY